MKTLVRIVFAIGVLFCSVEPVRGDMLPENETPGVDALRVLVYADIPVTLLNGMMLLGDKENPLTGAFGTLFGGATLAVSVGVLFFSEAENAQEKAFAGIAVGGVTLGLGLANIYRSKTGSEEREETTTKLSPGIFRGVDGEFVKGFVLRGRY